ncbi:MAG: hypothetical protein JWM09_437, partial [Francisellaceae bacterium]|nr:hypothetical protein [Francisellaceae bacterium]
MAFLKKANLFILLMMLSNQVLSYNPILITNSNYWNTSTKLFIGNCFNHSTMGICQIQLLNQSFSMNGYKNSLEKDEYYLDLLYVSNASQPNLEINDPEYKAFKKKWNQRMPVLYGLTNLGNLKIINANTLEIIGFFPIIDNSTILKKGYLQVQDVFLGKRWQSLLTAVVEIVDKKTSTKIEAQLFSIDVTDPECFKFGHPNLTYKNSSLGSIHLSSRPFIGRLTNYRWAIFIVAHQSETLTPGIQIIDLKKHKLIKNLEFQKLKNTIKEILLLDFYNKSIVPAVGIRDSGGGLWHLNVDFNKQNFHYSKVVDEPNIKDYKIGRAKDGKHLEWYILSHKNSNETYLRIITYPFLKFDSGPPKERQFIGKFSHLFIRP